MFQSGDLGGSPCDQACEHHGCSCPQITSRDRCCTEAGHSLNDGGTPINSDGGTHALKFGDMLQAIFVDLLADHAGALCSAHQGHERCLKIGWETWKGLSGDVNGCEFTRGDGHTLFIDFKRTSTVPELLQNSAEMFRDHRLHPEW